MESSTFIGRSDLLIEPVIEVIPMSEYNAAEAKQSASVKWLLARAFGRNVPDEFADPFYTSSNNGVQLRPAVLNAMATGDVYALAASSIFHDELLANEGHRAVLQALHRHFGQVVDADGNAITETLLRQTAPFRMNSHLMVIEYLMTALMRDLVNGQSVLSACRKLGPIAEGDLPPDGSEGATLYWINKVCENVRNRVESAAAVSGEEVPIIPEMDDVYEDICDGACVATVISYYRPEQLKFQDICFNDPMSLADCIHNLWLVKEFCAKHSAPAAIYHFSFEDVLYTHESLKPNFNVFLAELFHLLAGADVTDRPVAVSTRRSVSRLEPPPGSRGGQPRKLVKPMQSERKYNSRMNSIDSLIVDREANAQRPFGTGLGARPLGTVSFLDVSETNNNNNEAKGRRSQSTYERSDTMPCVKLNSTPSLIRMQLEEKRRLYEANRLKRNTELAEQRQKLSKLAFFQLRGKEVDGGASSSREKMGPGTAVGGGKSDESGFDQLTKNIKEMQEQMKRLYVEQEKLQQLVKSRHESTILLPTTAEAAAMAGCGQLLNAQSLVCLPTSTLGQFYAPMLLNKNGGETTPTVLSPTDEVPPGSKQQTSGDEQAFHLHSDGRSVSRLDPPLDISKSMTNWGMTCTGTKPPRRTWDSLANAAAENGMPVEERKPQAASMLELSTGGEGCQKRETSEEWKNAPVQVQQTTPKVAAVKAQQMAKERDVSPGIGFVIAAEDSAKNDEEELLKKKEQKLAAVLKRREEMEMRRAKVEEENAQRRARLQQKLEEQERRKRERELRRQRVLEEYQRKRAEQEAAEAGASIPTSMSVGVGVAGSQTSRSRTPRSSGQTPTSQSRSQIFMPTSSKTVSQANATSLSGLDSLTDSGIPDSGPNEPALKLYVKPVQKSNRTLVYNAIHFSVLVGTVNSDVKSKVLEELAKSDSKHFLLLFRDQKCQYRGLYSWDQMSDTVHKLHGVGPKYCNEAMMNQLYKYDSGSKQFSSIPSRHLSATIDGFTLKDEFWQKRTNVTPRR